MSAKIHALWRGELHSPIYTALTSVIENKLITFTAIKVVPSMFIINICETLKQTGNKKVNLLRKFLNAETQLYFLCLNVVKSVTLNMKIC